MKLYALISFLCIVAFVDSKSFDFSSFFPFNVYKTDVAPTTPSNKFSDSETSLETLPSSEYLEQELNASDVSARNESIHSETTEYVLSSSTENSTEKDLGNATSAEVGTQPSTKSKESLNSSASWEMGTSSAPPPGSNSSLGTSLFSSESSFNSTEEAEEVVLNTNPSTFTVVTKTIYEKTIEWVGDTYTLSILVPVAAGVLFAVSIILTVATCRWIRRKCRRREFRKRVLPDSIKNLRPSDQARLLGDCDSSDEF